jgi:hypothetical protein
VKDPTKRPTAEQLLGHPWIVSSRKESGPTLSEVASTLRNHSTSRKPLSRSPSVRNTTNVKDEETNKLKTNFEGKILFSS